MEKRRLKNLPEFPLPETVIENRGFFFTLDKKIIRCKLQSKLQHDKMVKRIPFLGVLFRPEVSEDDIRKHAESIVSALDTRIYREIITILRAYLEPKSIIMRWFLPLYLLRLDEVTLVDLLIMIFLANSDIKKKLVDTFLSLLSGENTKERWIAGVQRGYSLRNSSYHKLMRAFS